MTTAQTENKLKLGLFGPNLDGGLTATTVERFKLTWQSTTDVAVMADRAGFEVIVPVARWKGLTGKTHYNGINYDPLSWAAGLGPATEQIINFSTIHVTTIHPIVAAKQLTSIDHISGGRAGVNIVCGWFPAEFEMFGTPFMDHDARYEYATEWIEVIRKLWTLDDEFDYDGKYIKIVKGWAQPKPLQHPHPKIMQAGISEVGRRFSAKYADLAFVPNVEPPMWEKDFDRMRANYKDLRRMAHEEFGRHPEVWTSVGVICRPTRKEAEDYFRYCFYEHGDQEVLASIPPEALPPEGSVSNDRRREISHSMLVGFGGLVLLGTPEEIVDQLEQLSDLGLDGVALHWVNYTDELPTFIEEVMPLLEQAGLRHARPGSPGEPATGLRQPMASGI